MQVTFLGHGLESSQFNVGKQLVNSFENKYFDNFYGFVAFVALTGVDKILPSIKSSRDKFKNLRFYVGVDNKGTSKEALEKLLHNEIETYVYHRDEDYITYHPKLFLFEGEKFSRVIIGSSNLTSSGFIANIEASIQLDFNTKTDKQGIKLLREIKEYYNDLIELSNIHTRKLTRELIDEYDKDLNKLTNFILPGGAQTAAKFHFARTICRRAERNVVKLNKTSKNKNNANIMYLNRLSDLLFILARHENYKEKIKETIWKQ